MRKELLAVALCGVLLCGCGSSESQESTSASELPEGVEISYNEDSATSYSVSVIPFEHITYNDTEFVLEDFSTYEMYSDYEYYYLASVTFDVSGLSESELHWLYDEGELKSVDVYFTSEENAIDFDSMNTYNMWYSDGKVYYIFVSMDTFKNPVTDGEFAISVDVTQDEAYEYKEKEYNRTLSFNWYNINNEYGDISVEMKDFSELPQES